MNTMQLTNSYETISARETDIVRLLALGYSSKEIGDMLFISEHTVNTHRRNMVRKLDLRNTYQLIGWAFKQRVLSF
ncbi:DNA-binding CsgD family transcriptional regulator [Pedobacter sp. UYP30]|uniref:response regulator transcription factor n=1 Tax=Pedobacter sp. UYP30 TaxID=1756400 RepID=UPI003391A8C0